MSKFRKKPVVVEAEQFWPKKTPWPDGMYRSGTDRSAPGKPHYEVETLEGELSVSPGDFIITGIEGERYPCKPGIFEKTYEPCDEEGTSEEAK